MMKTAILTAGAVLALAVPARADVQLFSNGNPLGSWGYCNSNGDTCGLTGAAPDGSSSTFTLTSAARWKNSRTILTPGSNYKSPTGGFGRATQLAAAAPRPHLAVQGAVGSNCAVSAAHPACLSSPSGSTFTQTTISGLDSKNIDLAGGRYSIGFQNNLSNLDTASQYAATDNWVGTLTPFRPRIPEATSRRFRPPPSLCTGPSFRRIKPPPIPGQPIPEPSTWALLLLGFGGPSFAAYRRGMRPRAA